MPVPLLGRERELAQVREGVARLDAGRGALFFVVGEPGIGKTRFADEVALDAQARGVRVVWGRCWEGEGAPALWPWRQVLDAIGAAVPETPDASHAADARFALYAEVAARLVAASPLLIILDDLHVADRASLLLLQFVARTLPAPLAVVGTYRDAETEVGDLLPRIARDGTYLPLRRLHDDEIAAYATGLGVPLDADALAEVSRTTEGNPLFVDHVVRMRPRLDVPPTLRAALRSRIAAVTDEPARKLLDLAAVAGREVPLSVLARVAGMTPAAAADTLRPAIAAGVLTPPVRFSHVLLREELYASLPAGQRAKLHAALFEAVEALDAAAHHALEGVEHLGAERATAAVLRAAAHDAAVLGFDDAAKRLDRALEILPPFAEPGHIIDLEISCGLARIRSGDTVAGKASCARAAARARALGDSRRFAEAALAHGVELTPSLVDGSLIALLEESLTTLPAAEQALRARTLARLAAALQPADDPSVPVAMAREAVALSERLDEPDRRAVLYAASSALGDRGAPGESLAIDTKLCALARRAGDRAQALRVEARLVFDHMEAGNVAAADAHIEAYAALLADLQVVRLRWPLIAMRAMRALFDRRFDEVDRLHEELRAFDGGERDIHLGSVLGSQRFFRLLGEGHADEAEALLDTIRRRAQGANPQIAPVMHALRARVAVHRGDRAATAVELDALRRLGVRLDDVVIAKLCAEAFAFAGESTERACLRTVLTPHARGLVSYGLTAMVVDGPIARLLELLGRAPAALTCAPAVRQFALRRDGDVFHVESDGASVSLGDTIGLRLLAELVERPGVERHVLTLMPGEEGDAGAALDAEAIAAYRARVESLRDGIAEAERFADPVRAARHEEELEALTGELARAVGMRGRVRRAAASSERARVNVQRHLRKAIRAIAEHLPSLGRHLERSVRTGTYCIYEP
jgi:hypothetical protein